MLKRVSVLGAIAVFLLGASVASADSFSFTPSQITSIMASQGAPLSNGTSQWGLWAVRAMPIVGGTGAYTITGGSTTQTGWGVSAPNGAFGAAPYTQSNHAWFWDASGSEAALPANPLYMIMTQGATTFESYAFNSSGGFIGTCTFSSDPGCNLVTAVNLNALYSVTFTLGAGATWNGMWQFVVDGSRYSFGTSSSPGAWQENFFGGYGSGGGLTNNTGPGYIVTPEPTTLLLFGTGLAAIGGLARKKLAQKK